MIQNIFIQFLVSMLSIYSMAILTNAPKNQYVFCAFSGGITWAIYYFLAHYFIEGHLAMACLIATFVLTVLCRLFSVLLKTPVTLYLVPGIFPLVPGAGIYYTAYYFIMGDSLLFRTKGTETFLCAGAIALGIVFGFVLPQEIFSFFGKKEDCCEQ